MPNIENLDSLDRDELIYLARLAEQSERYEEMVNYVKAFVRKTGQDLSIDERNILSVAYKNVVGARRTSWRVVNSIEHKEERRGNASNKSAAERYRSEVEEELKRFCDDILHVVDADLIPRSANSESRVFYEKMKGDYYRYISEIAQGSAKEDAANKAEENYTRAYEIAKNDLPPTHPTRIGLALNFSVFYYEIKKEHEKSCNMAKTAFDEAIPELDNIPEENYKDATLILQLLRDNLTLWTSSEAGQD